MLNNKIQKILIVGGGGVGSLLATLLLELGMTVSVFDRQRNHALSTDVNFILGDVTDNEKLEDVMKNNETVVSCLPHYLTMAVANLAYKLNLHYFDPTEDVDDTNSIRLLANTSKRVMIPQCGLAPGFVGIVGAQLVKLFDKNTIHRLGLRVGALPVNPVGELGYACNWSPEGLINEYMGQASAIVGSEIKNIPGCTNKEILRLDGIEYEAISTSGGLGTMTETYADNVDNLDYKSIRYTGHQTEIKKLFEVLKYDRNEIISYMKQNYPPDSDDRVLVHVSAHGKINNKFQVKTFVADYRPHVIANVKREAIFWTTAASIAAVISLVNSGELPDSGFVKQEDISLEKLLSTKHGNLFYRNCTEISNILGVNNV